MGEESDFIGEVFGSVNPHVGCDFEEHEVKDGTSRRSLE